MYIELLKKSLSKEVRILKWSSCREEKRSDCFLTFLGWGEERDLICLGKIKQYNGYAKPGNWFSLRLRTSQSER